MRNKEAKEIRRQAKKNAPAVMARTLYNLNNAPLGIRLKFAFAVLFKSGLPPIWRTVS